MGIEPINSQLQILYQYAITATVNFCSFPILPFKPGGLCSVLAVNQ